MLRQEILSKKYDRTFASVTTCTHSKEIGFAVRVLILALRMLSVTLKSKRQWQQKGTVALMQQFLLWHLYLARLGGTSSSKS